MVDDYTVRNYDELDRHFTELASRERTRTNALRLKNFRQYVVWGSVAALAIGLLCILVAFAMYIWAKATPNTEIVTREAIVKTTVEPVEIPIDIVVTRQDVLTTVGEGRLDVFVNGAGSAGSSTTHRSSSSLEDSSTTIIIGDQPAKDDGSAAIDDPGESGSQQGVTPDGDPTESLIAESEPPNEGSEPSTESDLLPPSNENEATSSQRKSIRPVTNYFQLTSVPVRTSAGIDAVLTQWKWADSSNKDFPVEQRCHARKANENASLSDLIEFGYVDSNGTLYEEEHDRRTLARSGIDKLLFKKLQKNCRWFEESADT